MPYFVKQISLLIEIQQFELKSVSNWLSSVPIPLHTRSESLVILKATQHLQSKL